MTKEQRIAYSEKHERKMRSYERKYLRPVFTAVHSQILAFTKILREQGIDEAQRHIDTVIANDQIAPVILRLYADVGSYFADKTLFDINRSAKQETKGFGLNMDWIDNIINYFKRFLLAQVVVPITQTTKKYILEVLTQAQKEGWGTEKIARKLESDEITLKRARLITRTESVKAMFKGNQLAAAKSKWETEDTWIAAKDQRTRHSHRVVDGETVITGERFKVPTYARVGKVDVQTGFNNNIHEKQIINGKEIIST
jgi:hypothetical protein